MKLIDADAAINIVEFECGEWIGLARTIVEAIEQLPSAQPTIQPQTGKWIDAWRSKWDGTRYWYRTCDKCGYERNDCDPEKDSNFCPNCGARMETE